MINKKRGFVLVSAFLFISLFLISGVCADSGDNPLRSITETIANIVNMITGALEPLLGPLLGDVEEEDVFSAKMLFFIVILSVVWIGLNQVEIIEDHAWIHWLLTFTVTILATRTIGEQKWIQAMLLPYSTLGVAAATGGPFLIWFLFFNVGMKDKPSIIRKIAWIFFGIVFLVIGISRKGDFLTKAGVDFMLIYISVFALSLLMVFLDGTILKWWNRMRIDNAVAKFNSRMIIKLKSDLTDLANAATAGTIPYNEYKRVSKRIRKEIIKLGGSI